MASSEPLPKELENLDPLSCQLIQRAKCFRQLLGWHTHLKSANLYFFEGAMFHLSLPLEKERKL
uniref:Uncharacterized protein n=1 Tax=Amphimedon queenslandica TaxID=400682 RepID=A0A1X7VH85_AMPQE